MGKQQNRQRSICYAVKNGIEGNRIYSTWIDAKSALRKKTNNNNNTVCTCKKFDSIETAHLFLESDDDTYRKIPDSSVYVDGGCREGVGTIGIFFGVDDVQNVSAKLPGVHTSQTAELAAVIVALQNTQNQLTIFSDSMYVVLGVTKWYDVWVKNKRTNVKNIHLFRKISELIRGRSVTFVHVRRTCNIYGNKEADKLATAAFCV